MTIRASASRFAALARLDDSGGPSLGGLSLLPNGDDEFAAVVRLLGSRGSSSRPVEAQGSDAGGPLAVGPSANVAPSFARIGPAIVRVSTDSAGAQATGGDSFNPSFSPDGTKVVFQSAATNLVAGDTNGQVDIFIKDLTTGAITRVSTDSTGAQALGGSSQSAVFSPDGSKVAFFSEATNLVAGDTNGRIDIFVKDLGSGAVTRVSTDSLGGQAVGGDSYLPVFSPDGSKIAFYSYATNLVAGDTNGLPDIFVKDLVTGAMTRISTDSSGAQAVGGASFSPRFSPDGSKVAFNSYATNLVAGDTNGQSDIFIKDLTTGATTRVSTDSSGAQVNGDSEAPVFSPDGSKVAFFSGATNLAVGDTNGQIDVFIKDLATGAVTLVSTSSAGAQSSIGSSTYSVFSPDGSKIAFASTATTLVPGDTNGGTDIFIKDLVTGTTTRVSTSSTGAQGSGQMPAFAPDGYHVAFASSSALDGDSNGKSDIFVKEIGSPLPTFVENGAAVTPAAVVALSDADSSNYSGGTFSATITANAVAGDVLDIANSSGPAGIQVVGNSVRLNNVEFGVLSATATTLSVALNSNATDAAVAALAEAVRFASTSDNPTSAARTITYTIVDGGGTAGGGSDTASFNVVIPVTPVDDPPVAVPDGYSTNENVVLNIAAASGVLVNDTDVDGGAKFVAQAYGDSLAVGAIHSLPSGAKVTVNSDGSIVYNPNGSFNELISAAKAAATGAVNTTATDSFTYGLNGGSQTTVTVTINGVDGPGDELRGDGTNNTITGTSGNDSFRLEQGGNDIVSGGDGNDGFYFGAAFTAADQVDGGAGTNDQIGLQGNYTGASALVLGPNTIANIEALAVLPGFSYDITMNDGNVAAGGLLKVQATQLAAGQSLIFNGSNEHDGSFIVYGGQGNDNFTGGDGNDGFYFGPGGFTSADLVNGGPGGNDQLGLDGIYGSAGAPFVLGGNVTNVEVLVLLPAPSGPSNSFNLTTSEAFVTAGNSMTIFGVQQTTAITFDGSNEHDGAFRIYGGSGSDVFIGSAGNDWIFGGNGGDTLTGGPGNDIFYYDATAQSTPAVSDSIMDFASGDKVDVSGIDAVAGGADDAFSFLGSGAFTHHAGELRVANQGGSTYLVQGDTNGDGVADFQITLIVSDAHTITSADFTL